MARQDTAEADGAGGGDAAPKRKRLDDFDITEPKLPGRIAKRAMRSGDYPYDEPYDKDLYEEEIHALHIELVKVQTWVKAAGERVVILFEGRDAAGKGGLITRFTEHLNPRTVRTVALPKPNETEAGQWYFQRYVAQMPSRGEIVLFDRSWYNRAVVEPVFGFCTPAETERFLVEAPAFERMLVRDGVRLIKLWLTVGREMQLKRLHARYHSPLKRWKLSPIDFEAIGKWDAYSQAIDEMLRRTDSPETPWTIVRGNDKRRTRLEAIRHALWHLPYEGKDAKAIGPIDARIVLDAAAFLGVGGEPELAA